MHETAEQAFRAFSAARTDELRRQAYLLTGDHKRAEQLAERALAATQLRYRSLGTREADEFAREELVRSFVADPYPARARATRTAGNGNARAQANGGGRAAAWEALNSMPPRRRAVIVLRYDEGLTEQQIASRLGSTPRSILADAEAGMLTLRIALGGHGEPSELVPQALTEAGRHWPKWFAPAPDEVVARPALEGRRVGGLPVPRPPTGLLSAGTPARHDPARHDPPGPLQPGRLSPPPLDGSPHGLRSLALPSRGRSIWMALAAAAVAAVVLGAVLAIPNRHGSRIPAAAPQTAVSGNSVSAAQNSAQPVVPGLLPWPGRGPLAGDPKILAAASTAWQQHVPAREAPATGTSILYAGSLDGRTVVIVQALDKAGKLRAAQLDGASVDRLRLVHAERLSTAAGVVTIAPATGPGGALRVLVSPQAPQNGGLLATGNVPGGPLRPTPVGGDGVSGWLPAPPGAPTCSQIAVLRPSPTGGMHEPQVLAGGIVRADTMGILQSEVQIAPSTLIPDSTGAPDSTWFADGARLSKKAGGPVTVAALGPRPAATALSSMDKRKVESHVYEVRRGSNRWIGSVVTLGGYGVCASLIPTTAVGPQRPLSAFVVRCPLPTHMMAGVVHVVGGAGTDSVRVDLDATRWPAGQMPHHESVSRPPRTPENAAWTALAIVPEMFPCGQGVVHADGSGVSAIAGIPVYTP